MFTIWKTVFTSPKISCAFLTDCSMVLFVVLVLIIQLNESCLYNVRLGVDIVQFSTLLSYWQLITLYFIFGIIYIFPLKGISLVQIGAYTSCC